MRQCESFDEVGNTLHARSVISTGERYVIFGTSTSIACCSIAEILVGIVFINTKCLIFFVSHFQLNAKCCHNLKETAGPSG